MENNNALKSINQLPQERDCLPRLPKESDYLPKVKMMKFHHNK